MPDTRVRVLLIAANRGDYRLVAKLLRDSSASNFQLEWFASYAAGHEAVLRGEHDICLVDYRLGAATGIELLSDVAERGCTTPVIVLTGQGDGETDLLALRSGAVDYLVKGELTAPMLERSIRYALERHRLLEQIRALSLVDDLTGLYNRRGFYTLAEQQRIVATRSGKHALLLFADLDGMKQVNDRFGHNAGDQMLIRVAGLLRRSFRRTDVIARLGGDEFVVWAADAGEDSAELLITRLRSNLLENAASGSPWALSLSTGFVGYAPADGKTLDQLLSEADTLMYEQKQARKCGAEPALATMG